MPDLKGRTKVAVKSGYKKTAQMLLEKGADPHIQTNEEGYTALRFASERGYKGIVDLIQQFKQKPI